MVINCGFLDSVPESFFWIHSLHALDALAAGSALASAPQLCLPRGTQGVIQSNPKLPSARHTLRLPLHCYCTSLLPESFQRYLVCFRYFTLLVGFLRPRSRGHETFNLRLFL